MTGAKIWLLAFVFPVRSGAFDVSRSGRDGIKTAVKAVANESSQVSREGFLSVAASAVLGWTAAPPLSFAEGDEFSASVDPKPPRSISGCPKPTSGKANNCVSTSNVKQLDTYMPPWTFEVSADEAFARLKGAIASDPSLSTTEVDEDGRFIRLEVLRPLAQDEVQFLVKAADKVVTFQSNEIDGGSVSDFGANRNRIETMRKKCGVFEVMGGGMTADSYGNVGSDRGGGALGQLKAFYGLQSGKGYQDIYEED